MNHKRVPKGGNEKGKKQMSSFFFFRFVALLVQTLFGQDVFSVSSCSSMLPAFLKPSW